ncbi:YbhB/YbcL family Raf kinase inhibitor-like protein [Pseudomonadota bacterium]
MRKLQFILLFLMIAGCAQQAPLQTEEITLTNQNMKLSSSAFENDSDIPSQYTCDGQDINPNLKVEDVPQDAVSLVLIVDDPDAPVGDWVHWTLWSIPADISEISENSVPHGATEGLTDFGRSGWGGPCPPSGTHRYYFKLFALDIDLILDHSAKKADILDAMKGHIVDQTELIGLYQRN